MNIGLDLDHTVCGFPEFFREFIPAMLDRGHKLFCTSGRPLKRWPQYKAYLEGLGFTRLDEIETCLMGAHGAAGKAAVADRVDIVFDDHADAFQSLTKTPVFKTPSSKARVDSIPGVP